jgi:AraC-like DNA-binding protein
MINLHELDLMTRAAALALIILLGLMLARDHIRALAAKLALCMMFCVVAYLFAEPPGYEQRSAVLNALLMLGEIAIFPIFWLFARIWFDDEDRIGWRSWLIVSATMVLAIIKILTYRHIPSKFEWPLDLANRSSWIALVLAGLVVAWRGRKDDLVEARRRLRVVFVWTVGIAEIIITIIYLVYNQMLGERAPDSVTIAVNIAILVIAIALATALFSSRHPNLFDARVPVADTKDDATLAILAERLRAHMSEGLVWRDETLTISGLAAQLGEQEYRLRRTINRQMGHRNFASFLNGYRVDEVKAALDDPGQNSVSILTVALDAGFGSLGTFNRAFRTAEGMTPSEYRAKSG